MLGCSTNRIRMAEEDGRRPGYTIEELRNMRQVLGASPTRAPMDMPAIIAVQGYCVLLDPPSTLADMA